MKKTLYIHIGTHKTGTTAIQKFSAEKAKELLELDIYYPNISRPIINKISNGHHLLPWYLVGHPVPAKYYGEYHDKRDLLFPSLIEEIKSSSCQNIILSSEEFDRLKKGEIEKLKEYFEDFDVKIIAYLRRKDSYIESMYQTDVISNNQKNDIFEYMKQVPIPLDYYSFVTNWQNVFGKENIFINFYCKKSLQSSNIVIDFYHKLGFDIHGLIESVKTEKVNSSVPFQYIATISMLRRMDAPDHIVNVLRRLSYKLSDTADKSYHFLPLDERLKLAKSGLEEIKKLNLNLPDDDCFSLSEEEQANDKVNGRFAALKQVFIDFENYMDRQEEN